MDKKKRNLVIILLSICLVVLCVILLMIFGSFKTNEQKIVNKLSSMGEEIYIEYYYPRMSSGKTKSEVSDYLSKFSDSGLKFTLIELEKYNDQFKDNISKFKSDKKVCDKDKTMVIIYPTEPYSKTDFTTDIILDCGF